MTTEVIFLGTADSIPSANRNHTSILLKNNAENILVDCGEGTQRQFRKLKLNPCKVTKILISHWHGDHILGLPGFLSTLALSGYNKKLDIYGPVGIKEKIDDMLKVFSFKRDYKILVEEIGPGKFFENEDFYLESEEMDHGIPCLAYSLIEKGHIRIKKDKLSSIKPGAYLKELKAGKDVEFEGKILKFKNYVYKEDDKKLSIVLDTKLNDKIIPFVKGANLFISEGSYSSDLEEEAMEHMHLTVGQVGEIAKKAKVERLIVTHVSSRYLKDIKGLIEEVKNIFEDVYFVKDLESFIL